MAEWWRRDRTASLIPPKGAEGGLAEAKRGLSRASDAADEDVAHVSLADKIRNARAILRDLRKPDIGEGTVGLLRGHATVQREYGAGCEPAFIAREKQDAGGDLLGGT